MSAGGDRTGRGGVGFFGLLTLLFVALKLTGYINWSWWAVTAPLWGPLAAVLVGVVVYLLVSAVYIFLVEPLLRRWRAR